MDKEFLEKLDKLKESYDKYVDVLLNDTVMTPNFSYLNSYFDNNIPLIEYFHIKMNNDANIESYYIDDLKYRPKIINMNKFSNHHILEIFDIEMLKHLHQFKVSYRYLHKPVIDENNLENYDILVNKISSFLDIFKSKEYVLSLGDQLNLFDIFYYKHQQGRPKIYSNEEIEKRRKTQNKIAHRKYIKSDKGKIKSREKSLKYYYKKKSNSNSNSNFVCIKSV